MAKDILGTVSQILEVQEKSIHLMATEVLFHDLSLPWKKSYLEYQSGDWHTLTLMNPSGMAADNKISDGIAVPTQFLKLLPQIDAFLKKLNLKYMWVRLAKLAPNGFLWEHTDYTELNTERRLRLHLPLLTNDKSIISFPDVNVHLAKGFLWKLDPTSRHGAANMGTSTRIHLILDCYYDLQLEQILKNEYLDPTFVFKKPNLDVHISDLQDLKYIGHEKAALDLLLKSFHRYAMGDQYSYDLVVEYFKEDTEQSRHWANLKQYYITGGIKA